MKSVVNQKKTILLIDDDEDDCLFLSYALAAISNGIALTCVKTTDHLWETIESNKPSLIVIDFYLPKRNALDGFRQIKNHPDYKHIPVVMCGTCNEDVRTPNQDMPHFFQKPCCFKDWVLQFSAILQQNGIELQQSQLVVR